MDENSDQRTISQFAEKGDPRSTLRWHEGIPDYVSEFGLQPGHIGTLVEIARKWSDDETLREDAWSAPIHAWRALGQLRAVEAIEPLLAMQNRLDELGDEWYLEEFHKVFCLIGPPAVTALTEYLADRNNKEYPRISTANGLCKIGKRHPETRDQVVGVLTNQLAEPEPSGCSFSGFLIGYLADLKATESAEVIERAFATGLVDETVCGEWGTIRKELGVAGLGLVPDRPSLPRPHFVFDGAPEDLAPVDRLSRDRQRQAEKKAKAKRKQQKRARKRNQARR